MGKNRSCEGHLLSREEDPVSAIAMFKKIPISALEGLQEAAAPTKSIFGTPKDEYGDYLKAHSREVADYQWSGFVIATLLPYLKQVHQVDLMASEFEELAKFLTETRRATHIFLTNDHKQAYLSNLGTQFSVEDLEAYYNEFNQTNEAGVGIAMRDGIVAIREALGEVDGQSVILVAIG